MKINPAEHGGLFGPSVRVAVTFESLDERQLFGGHTSPLSKEGLRYVNHNNWLIGHPFAVSDRAYRDEEGYPQTVKIGLKTVCAAAIGLSLWTQGRGEEHPEEADIVRTIGEYVTSLSERSQESVIAELKDARFTQSRLLDWD